MLITEDGNQLMKWTAVVNASTHRCFGTLLYLIKVKAKTYIIDMNTRLIEMNRGVR